MRKLKYITLYVLLLLVGNLKAVEELNHASHTIEDIHEERDLELPAQLDKTVSV